VGRRAIGAAGGDACYGSGLTLRTELSLVLSSLLAVSIGLAGGTAIYQSARNMRRELTTEHQLFAENRAFALRDNFEILEDELKRLALLPQMDMGDGDSMPEQLTLAGAHEHSVLYNTAVLLLDDRGLGLRAVPDRPEFRGQSFGDRGWFKAARGGSTEPVFRGTDEPGVGRTIKIIQPIHRGTRFMGALVGVISLGDTNLITPALLENLPPATDAVLVDKTGAIVYPPDRARAAVGSGWERAIAASTTGMTGALSGEANGQESLFAYSSVRAGTPYALVFSWPWSALTANLRQQAWTLAGILLFGLVLAAIAGLALSAYLTRPLEALGDAAIRIARGEHGRGGCAGGRLRPHGDVDPPARPGAARGGRAAGAAGEDPHPGAGGGAAGAGRGRTLRRDGQDLGRHRP
jgi:hypothetical protein